MVFRGVFILQLRFFKIFFLFLFQFFGIFAEKKLEPCEFFRLGRPWTYPRIYERSFRATNLQLHGKECFFYLLLRFGLL